MNSTQELVQAIISGKATDIETTFKSAISDRVLDLVADKKAEIAQSMFKRDIEN